MLTLILAGLRHRAAALLAIVVAAGLGSALIVMCGAMFETGIRLSAPPERISSADLAVIGDPSYTMLGRDGEQTTDRRPFPERHRLSASAANEADGIDGIERIVPVRFHQALAQTPDRSLPITAQNWASIAVSGISPTPAKGPGSGEVVLTAAAAKALAVAEREDLLLTMDGQTLSVRAAAVVGNRDDPPTVFLRDEAAGSRDPVDALGVVLAQDADISAVRAALHTELGEVRVLAGDGRGAAEDPEVSAARLPAIVVGAVTGGIVLTVLATVISGIVALSVRQRSREISLLRATGATGRQARTLVVGEVTAAGLLGALLGLIPGIPLAHVLHLGMQTGGALPPGLELSAGPIPLAIAAAVTALVVWLAAVLAARSARRSRPLDALREAELPAARIGMMRWLPGILFGLGAAALGVLTALMPPVLVSATAGPAVLAGTISAALLAPGLLRLAVAMLRPVLGGRGLAGLAWSSLSSRTATLSTVTGATALVFGIGAGNLVSASMLTTAAVDAQVQTITADAMVTGPAGAAAERAADIMALPEVDAATPFLASGGWIERPYDASHRDSPWPVRGIDGSQAQEVLSNRLVAGSLADLSGSSVALPSHTAADLGVDIGDTVHFRFGDGEGGELRVAATFEDLPGYENLLLPVELLAAHTSARAPAVLLVSASDGTAPGALLPAVEGVVSGNPSVTVGDRGAVEASLQEGLNINALINGLLLLVVLAYAMVAVTNTVAVSTLGRRRELAMLRLTGATRGQLRALLLTETAVCAAVGVGVALIVACAAILPTAVVVGVSPLAPQPLAILLGLCGAVALTTLPITAIAARLAMGGRLSATVNAA